MNTSLIFGTDAGNSDGAPVASHYVDRSEPASAMVLTATNVRNYLQKKLVRKVKSLPNLSYLRGATNLNLDVNTSNSITFPYISSAGGFQPWVQCLSQLHFPAGATGFLLPLRSGNYSLPYFLTSNSCDK